MDKENASLQESLAILNSEYQDLKRKSSNFYTLVDEDCNLNCLFKANNGNDNNEDQAKIILREVDTVLLPGKKEPITLFELVGLKEEVSEDLQKTIATYTEGLAAYRQKDFAKAIASFKTCGEDNPAKVMLARCELLLKGEKIPELDEAMVFRILNK